MPNTKKARALLLTLSISALVAGATMAYAVTLRSVAGKAAIQALVLPALRIQKGSELAFRSAAPGAKAEIIAPRSRAGAGNWRVVGLPNQAYIPILPDDVSLTSAVSANQGRNVRITNFTSYPALGSGLLSSIGQFDNFLGATRQQLPRDIPAGYYQGNYTLTVAFP